MHFKDNDYEKALDVAFGKVFISLLSVCLIYSKTGESDDREQYVVFLDLIGQCFDKLGFHNPGVKYFLRLIINL
jgi:hypothetical protein